MMPASLAELLHDWHDFYILVGTASATLVGLMFVAASIGASFFNESHNAPMQAFLTPTVVHFAATLFACLLVTIPTHSWHTLGALLGAGGLAGAIYSGRILVDIIVMRRFKVDASDRLFYALVPLVGYLIAIAASVLLFLQYAMSVNVIAAALLTLLFAAIRNAWDMMCWMVVKSPSPRAPPE
jgi:hypothetical protein